MLGSTGVHSFVSSTPPNRLNGTVTDVPAAITSKWSSACPFKYS